jgi:hypothetical protein
MMESPGLHRLGGRQLFSTRCISRLSVVVITGGVRHASASAGPSSPLLPLSSSTSPPPAAHTTFRSATRFKLSPAQVNETNVPSAKEVGELIPTLRELRAQLPDARDLEQRYIRPEEMVAPSAASTPTSTNIVGDGSAIDGVTTTSATSTIFQKTTDPLEDLLFGPPKEEGGSTSLGMDHMQHPRRQHLLLAYQALLWGTVYAFVGFVVTVAMAMYACGYHTLGELREGVRGKLSRDEERLRAVAGSSGGAADGVVEHYVIDLTNPTEAWRQMQDVWLAVQRLATEEEESRHIDSSAQGR